MTTRVTLKVAGKPLEFTPVVRPETSLGDLAPGIALSLGTDPHMLTFTDAKGARLDPATRVLGAGTRFTVSLPVVTVHMQDGAIYPFEVDPRKTTGKQLALLIRQQTAQRGAKIMLLTKAVGGRVLDPYTPIVEEHVYALAIPCPMAVMEHRLCWNQHGQPQVPGKIIAIVNSEDEALAVLPRGIGKGTAKGYLDWDEESQSYCLFRSNTLQYRAHLLDVK